MELSAWPEPPDAANWSFAIELVKVDAGSFADPTQNTYPVRSSANVIASYPSRLGRSKGAWDDLRYTYGSEAPTLTGSCRIGCGIARQSG